MLPDLFLGRMGKGQYPGLLYNWNWTNDHTATQLFTSTPRLYKWGSFI